MNDNATLQLADRNFYDSVLRQVQCSEGAESFEFDGALIALGGTRLPAGPFNAVVRSSERACPVSLLTQAEAAFSRRGHGFSVYARAHGDAALELACRSRGYVAAGDLAIMGLERAPPSELTPGVTIELVSDTRGVERFANVAADSFAAIGLPKAAAKSAFSRPERLLEPGFQLLVAHHAGEPAGCALLLSSATTAGIYWLGTQPQALRRGIATACVRAVTQFAFQTGARAVFLQAARALEPFYCRLGFSTLSTLKIYASLAGRLRH